ncbi:MAG TPA: STAS domain-containing protein [Acidobacteriaceae bacterium]|jgi:anti-sigma B factor antagonist|nr:STAS domain-containing protein [Acidobacteriaceae bacterium]
MHEAPLSYTARDGVRAGTTILKLTGPLTLSNMFAFQNDLRSMNSPVLILDMSDVVYMDSAGLGLLMNGYVSAENHQRKFLLAAVNDRISALLQMTKVDRILPVFPSVEAAEDSI